MFTLRTDDACAVQYFQFYGFLSQQQNMLQVWNGEEQKKKSSEKVHIWVAGTERLTVAEMKVI